MRWITKFFNNLFYTIFPEICVYCNTPLKYLQEKWLCKNCYEKIKFINSLICKRCGLPLPDGGAYCYNCKTKKSRRWWVETIRGAVEYKEPVKSIIHKFKYNNKPYLKMLLVSLMVKYISMSQDFLNDVELICCVPVSRYKKFFRGYNQAELLAEEFSKIYNIPFVNNLLIRRKNTVSQFKLSREERLANVEDAFEIKDGFEIKNKNVLIIDDVCTTGETINQCAKVLIKAKAKKVKALVVARDV